MESKEQYKRTNKNRNRLIDTGNRLSVARGEVEGLVEKIEKEKLEVRNSHGYVKYNIGNIVNNTGISIFGGCWVLEISGGTFFEVYD